MASADEKISKESEHRKMLYRRELRDEVWQREIEARAVLQSTENEQFAEYRSITDPLVKEFLSQQAEERRLAAESAVRNASRAANQKWHDREDEQNDREQRVNAALPTSCEGWGQDAGRIKAQEKEKQDECHAKQRNELDSSESIRRAFVLQSERAAYQSLCQARKHSSKLCSTPNQRTGSGAIHFGDLNEHEMARRGLLRQMEQVSWVRLARTFVEDLVPSDEERDDVLLDMAVITGDIPRTKQQQLPAAFVTKQAVNETKVRQIELQRLRPLFTKWLDLHHEHRGETQRQLFERESLRRGLLVRSQQVF